MNNFSRIITLLRKERSITQKQAALDLGISQALLSHYEKGLRECGLDFLIKLCDYYNVSSDYVLGRTADRNGVVLDVFELSDAELKSDSKFTGSVLPTMNKRLISSSLNIIYDKLSKAKNKEVTTLVSNYLMISCYKMFRMIYNSNKQNSLSLFDISSPLFDGYTNAALLRTSASLSEVLSNKSVSKEISPYFEMTTDSLSKDYPNQITALLNVVKYSEENIK